MASTAEGSVEALLGASRTSSTSSSGGGSGEALKEKQQQQEAEADPGCYDRVNSGLRAISNACNAFFFYVFWHIGRFCARNPAGVMTCAALVAGLAAIGCVQFEIENRGDKLWIPQDSVALEQAGLVGALYTNEPRVSYVIVEPREGDNALTSVALVAAMNLHLEIAALNVTVPVEEEGADDGGGEGDAPEWWYLQNLCVFRPGTTECDIDSILSLWNFDLAALEADADPLATINARNRQDPTAVLRQLGGIDFDDSGEIIGATALKTVYLLDNRGQVLGGSVVDLPAETWELAFISLTRAENDQLYVYPEAERSYTDEFNEAVTSDVVILLAGFALIIVYTAVVLGKFSFLRSRVVLSLMGIVSIGFAIAFSFGLASAFGYKYNYVHSVLPFLLLAVGVDNVFIIFNAYQQTDPHESIEMRTAEAMAHAGVSITVTSLTNFFAFLIGATSPLPALQSFCVFTALAAVGLYFFQITWFCSALVLDEHRIANGRLDCCCCIRRPYEKIDSPTKRGYVPYFLEVYWAPFVLKRPMRLLIILATLALAGVSIWGVTQVVIKDALSSFVPDGSYVSVTQDVNANLFVDLGDPVDIVTTGTVQYGNPDVQALLAGLTADLNGTAFMYPTNSAFYRSWFDEYIAWLGTSEYKDQLDSNGRPPNATVFNEWLRAFLVTPEGQLYSNDVVFGPGANGAILSTRIRWSYEPLSSAPEEVQAMYALRDKCAELEIEAFPWTYLYLTWEQNAVVESSIYSSLLSSLIIVFVIILLLIAQPIVALLVELCVALVILDIIGLMTFWDVALDSVSAVNLVLAVGLSVDYVAHIGHCFMLKQGTRDERVIAAIADIGNSVINGALSTFLAIMLLSVSQSYVFIVFFKQFFLVCVLSVFHAMLFLPVALSFIGPAAYEPQEDMKMSELATMENGGGTVSRYLAMCCGGSRETVEEARQLRASLNETRRLLDEECRQIAQRDKEVREMWEKQRQLEAEREAERVKERELMSRVLSALERQGLPSDVTINGTTAAV